MNHGTKSGYDTGGCRCTECKAAHAAYQRRYRAGERAPPKPSMVVDFTARNLVGNKILTGDVRERKTSNVGGGPAVATVMVSALGINPGDTVEITYGADEIVIRRAPKAVAP